MALSILVGYLMPNPVNTYIHTYIYMICKKNGLLVTCLNEVELIYLHTVKWFQVLLTQVILFNISGFK